MADSVHGTLTPNQVEQVQVAADRVQGINILNRSLTGTIWVRFDGQDPEPLVEGSFAVLGARNYPYPMAAAGRPCQVRMVSTDALEYSVEGSPSWGGPDDA